MGTFWSARVVDGGPHTAAIVQAALDSVVAQMSHWEPQSDLSRFNHAPPRQWVAIPPEFSAVLAAAGAVTRASDGAFDAAVGRIADLWGFGPSGGRAAPPHAEAVATARAASGWGQIEHDAPLLRARRLGDARLDLSGIAKGYGADRAAAALRAAGHDDFLVEVGGELVGSGIRPDGQPWWIDVESVPGARLPPLRIALHDFAVATSGDYRRGFDHDGRRFPHSIDPGSGRPIDHGVASVTVLHAQAMLADAWATALTILGPEAGPACAAREGLAMHLVHRCPGGGFAEHLSPALEAMVG